MGRREILVAALGLLAAACGYGFSQRYVAVGGVDRVHVRPFNNLSTEPELGAAVTAALRKELAQRGSDAGEGAPAALEGEVRATEPSPTSTVATTWRIALEVRARLVTAGRAPDERIVRREVEYLAGADPLETEGRRALALRRLADDAARELLSALQR